jgi:hypothetical protein
MPLDSGSPYAATNLGVPGGIPATALGARTAADAAACCAQATADIDSLAFRGSYGTGFSFSRVGLDVSFRCVQRANWLFLNQRGYNPEADADKLIMAGNVDFLAWCDRVHRQIEFPDVTVSTSPNFQARPLATSRSSVNMDGCHAPTRRW